MSHVILPLELLAVYIQQVLPKLRAAPYCGNGHNSAVSPTLTLFHIPQSTHLEIIIFDPASKFAFSFSSRYLQ